MKQPLAWAWFFAVSACTIHVDDDYERSGRFGDARWWSDSDWSSEGDCRDHDDCSNDCYCAQGQCSELPFCRHHWECPEGAFCSRRLERCVIEDDGSTSTASDDDRGGEDRTGGASSVTRDGETSGYATPGDASSTAARHDSNAEYSSADSQDQPGVESNSSTGRADTHAAPFDAGAGELSADASNAETLPAESSWPADAASCSTADGSIDCGARPPVCFSNADCGDGLCVNAQCQSFCEASSACRADEACVLGLCRPVDALECTVRADCPESDDCVNGRCVRRCLSDADCEQCDDGPSCGNGYCGP